MLQYLHFEDRESWLSGRVGLGASDAAAVCGLSKWQTPLGLWEIKTGRKKAKDLSGNAAVSFGVRAEPHLRGLFLAEHPEYQLEYHPFDILYQEERPWLTATLDGELITETGEHGSFGNQNCAVQFQRGLGGMGATGSRRTITRRFATSSLPRDILSRSFSRF